MKETYMLDGDIFSGDNWKIKPDIDEIEETDEKEANEPEK